MMAEDGYRTLSPEAWTAKYKPAVDHPLEVSLANATNSLERQLTFVGDLKHIEFQALGVRRTLQDSYERARAIHVTVDSLRPVLESDNWIAHGVYILPAVLRSGVETKHAVPGTWFDIPKGGGTTDSDIESRRILAVDCDVVRSSGTSATEEEMIRSVHVALRIWNYLEGALVDSRAMAYIHSGNGRRDPSRPRLASERRRVQALRFWHPHRPRVPVRYARGQGRSEALRRQTNLTSLRNAEKEGRTRHT